MPFEHSNDILSSSNISITVPKFERNDDNLPKNVNLTKFEKSFRVFKAEKPPWQLPVQVYFLRDRKIFNVD